MAFRALLLLLAATAARAAQTMTFSKDFMFGAATASYQIEGAWNENGKGESIWDHLVHEHPEYIRDGSTGDVADDSFHKYKEDVQLLKDLGADFYRFSIAWPRILPNGDLSEISEEGIKYYSDLIDELLAQGLEPFVTLYHWDLPEKLEDVGGWLNESMVGYFTDYSRLMFERYGDRVKWWITFNEPLTFTTGYATLGQMAPSANMPGVGDYLAAHTLLLAHARVWHMYDEEFRPTQKGKISITLNSDWMEPGSDAPEDIAAAERAQQFDLGWFAHPIYTEEGDYPPVMRERVDANSFAEGRNVSRLPTFTPEQVKYLKGTHDFFGLNHYTSNLVVDANLTGGPNRYIDASVASWKDDSWPTSASSWLRVVPWGFRNLINWIEKRYNGVPIIVTESGTSDEGDIDDQARVYYYKSYITEMWKAINEDGANVIGYTAWSLMDNFEWNQGYAEKFGIYRVDYSKPDRPRTPKSSVAFIKKLFTTKTIPE